MKKLIIFFLFLTASLTQGQTVLTSIIDADSLGHIFKLGINEAITYVMVTDSLTNMTDSSAASAKTLEFYIFYGDTTGYTVGDTTSGVTDSIGALADITDPKWTLLKDKDDGATVYSVALAEQSTIPLTFNNIVGILGLQARKNWGMFICPYIVGGVGTTVYLKFGTIKMTQ